ncbi:hypothetical protein HIM_04975 [Hirsutella minnesotensis 3608]|uniref:UBC core domain-containing protein n=1 Tax=Hirsutella minnesotensis 3608 TaxID=1043627 RepID=A0A0F8A0P6_9HYPO|nr:hypothetical protein HIM_04975 [Hirsutella minnesotensis 3608]
MATNSAPQISSKSPTIRRILREAAEISSSPSADYTAEPLDSDLFEWHFTLRGPPNSVYSQGFYHGRIVLPPTYPLRPPSFRFTTPNGRFEANREICLSISGHHEETWQPAWGIRTALVALRSFMETDARGQLGGIDTTDAVRLRLAQESGSFQCHTCAVTNAQIIEEAERRAQESSTAAADVQVPQELSMEWKDEMEAAKQEARDATPLVLNETRDRPSKDGDGASESAELAEGFVDTGPRPMVTPQKRSLAPASHPATRQNQSIQHAQAPVQLNQGVLMWIDRAIVALVVILAALLLKVLFDM